MLSERLQTVADMVNECQSLADIGTDHGYIPIALCKAGKINRAIAADISAGSCDKARANIGFYGLNDKIEVRCGDGLRVLDEGEYIDCILISGMGGQLIIDVLSSNTDAVCSAKQLVLQPQKDIDKVRRYIHKIGYKIENEIILIDAGKYYTVINAVKGKEEYTEAEYMIGKCLIKNKGEIFKAYIQYEYNKINIMIDNMSNAHSDDIKTRIDKAKQKKAIYEEVLKCL